MHPTLTGPVILIPYLNSVSRGRVWHDKGRFDIIWVREWYEIARVW